MVDSTSCECPTPDLSNMDDSNTKPPDVCEFEMKYHDLQNRAEVKRETL